MTDLQTLYQSRRAHLAPDGIPLHFGSVKAEFSAALSQSVVFDRSHEGRLTLSGADRLDLLNRLSTNQLLDLKRDEGRATIFLNANARILDRVMIYHWREDAVLLVAGPGRNVPVHRYLSSNIFYNDKVTLTDVQAESHQFCVMGTDATERLARLVPSILVNGQGGWGEVDGVEVFAGRTKSFHGDVWNLIVPKDSAAAVWSALMSHGFIPSGGLAYHALRIRAGEPGVGFELTDSYIPLELGLWDEVSFNKGCYTGQEIIARMESRNKLAKMLVRLSQTVFHAPGTVLFHEGKRVGEITSSVTAPDGLHDAMGVVKVDYATEGTVLHAAEATGDEIIVGAVLGVQPMRPR